MPNWPPCLCVPRNIRSKSQTEELDFFERTLPLHSIASFRAAYHALFGIYAAVADADREAFCKAVAVMQRTTWKKAEWREYDLPLKRLHDQLVRIGADCVGMSSLGPMLFCLGSSTTLDNIVHRRDVLDCDIFRTAPDNTGRAIMQE
jgi:beta-ribofuranosylaminobenzene 5'-phosphate synthase